jgi:Trypsin/PASTA domain
MVFSGRIRLALLAALVGLLLAPGGARSEPPRGTIVGGEPASPGEYPAQAFLDIDGGYCGGTLVAPTKILTAAHCFVGVPPQDVVAYLGENDRNQFTSNDAYAVSAVNVNADFNFGTFENDTAMLTLSSAPPFQPLRVIGADEASKWTAGVSATIIGWGTTSSGGPESEVLLEAQVPIISDAACDDAYGNEFDPQTMVCAYDGQHDTCQGDSGGPLLVPDDGGGFVLAGLTSWGYGCADLGNPGVYTRVGAATLNAWIVARLGGPSPPPPPPPTPPPPTPPPPPAPPPPLPPPPLPPPALPPPALPPPPPVEPPPPPPVEPPPPARVIRCAVPQLRGRTLRSARLVLVRANCRLGTVTRTFSARVAAGRVISQRPSAGRRLARYTRVSVVLSRGKR